MGNRAILLGDGEDEIQLYYSPSYTAVSAILPVIVIFLGLIIADKFYKNSKRALTRYSSLIVCGVCAGAAVTEMHYLGNNGTTDYKLILSLPHVFGAASIAVGACLISFGLFFHWSGHWVNFIWRRVVVACFLALAVSGMHWTAAAGTWYELQGYHEGPGQQRNVTLIIALCLVSLFPMSSPPSHQALASFVPRLNFEYYQSARKLGLYSYGFCLAPHDELFKSLVCSNSHVAR